MRVFVYDGRRYPDNHPDKTVDEVRQFMANYFPELSNATVKESRDGDDTVFEFSRRVGTKGGYKVLEETTLQCTNCHQANFVVTEGGEVARMLSCNRCGQYMYYVGNVLCVRFMSSAFPSEEERGAIQRILGAQTLAPWAQAHVAALRSKLGLDDEGGEGAR